MKKEERNECILVVDDVEMARNMGAAFLKKAGFQVIEASGGNDGIRKFVEFNPVIVLLDLNMPEVDGIQTLRMIRRINPKAQVLICTANDDYRVIKITLQEGAIGYVIKPYRGSELLKKIQEILESGM
jgi:two-component system chemotaxis response regulator CheY